MLGLIAIAVAYVVAMKLDDSSDYKLPKGKYKNTYR